MKYIATFFSFFFPAFAIAQLNPVQMWKTAEPIGHNELKPPALLVDEGKNTYMITHQTKFNPTIGFCLVKYDSLGTRKWLQWHSSSFKNTHNDYVIDKTGDIYVGITAKNPIPGNHADFILLKYDTDGSLIWEEPVGKNNFSTFNVVSHLAMDTLDHLYALGHTEGSTLGDNSLFVFCFDISSATSVKEVWKTIIPGVHYTGGFHLMSDRLEALSSGSDSTGSYIAISQIAFDGSIIQSIKKPYPTTLSVEFNHFLSDGSIVFGSRSFFHKALKVDAQGDTIWYYHLPPVTSDQGLKVLSITEDNSSHTYITGCHNFLDTYIDGVTTKLDAGGNVVWQDIYTLESAVSAECFSKVVVDNSYVYLIGSGTNISDSSLKEDALVLILDKSNGERLAELRFLHNNTETIPQDIDLLNDGFIVACISNNDENIPIDSTEIITYRFRLPKSSATAEPQWLHYMEVYPNPAQGYCFVSQAAERPFQQLTICDLSGKVVIRQDFPHLIEQVDVSGLPPGQYVLKATGAGAAAIAKLVVVR